MNNSTKVDFESCTLFGCFNMPKFKAHIDNEYLDRFYAFLKRNCGFCNLSHIPEYQCDMGSVDIDVLSADWSYIRGLMAYDMSKVSFLCKYDEDTYAALFCEVSKFELYTNTEYPVESKYRKHFKIEYSIKDVSFYDTSCIDIYIYIYI